MRSRSDFAVHAPSARAPRALVTAILAALVVCPACTSEPDTIRLLEKQDAGSTGCRSDAECTAEHPRCEPTEHRCVDCLLASECPQGLVCSSTSHTCESRCASGADCAGLDQTVCNSDGACVQCASDYDCAGTAMTPRCNLRNGVCVQCVLATDCNPRSCFDDCLTCLNNQCVWKT